MAILKHNAGNDAVLNIRRAHSPLAGFSGADIRASISIRPDKAKDDDTYKKSFKTFAELQTITITSHRGSGAVRALGESFVREYTRGTRTFGGTMIFSVLEKNVFSELYCESKTELSNRYPAFVDMLPPMTITIQAVNEDGRFATMALYEVVLLNYGMTLSIDDLNTESQYTYVAKWVTPFVDGTTHTAILENLQEITDSVIPLSSCILKR